jgi:hypothetical protein
MRALVICGLVGFLVLIANLSFGELAPAPNPDESGENNSTTAVQKKRADCRQVGTGQGLRGPDLVDYVSVCVQEARLACLKQTVQQKIRGPERTNFINKCLGS